jgi:hypothetical protein
MAYGFVYVLANRAMPGIYKVGRTDRAPRERMDELSRSTAVPYEFDLVLYAQVDDAVTAEAELHTELKFCRVNKSREFFRTSLDNLRTTIHENEHTLDICDVEFDLLFWHEQQEREERFTINHFLSQCHDPIHWNAHRGFE